MCVKTHIRVKAFLKHLNLDLEEQMKCFHRNAVALGNNHGTTCYR